MAHTQTVNAAQAATIRYFQATARENGSTIEVFATPSKVSLVETFPEGYGLVWLIDDEGNSSLEPLVP